MVKRCRIQSTSKEETAFESWADETANEYATEPKDEEDRREKLKALNDIQKNPDLRAILKCRTQVTKEEWNYREQNKKALHLKI